MDPLNKKSHITWKGALVLLMMIVHPWVALAQGGFEDVEGPQAKAIRYLKDKGVVEGYLNGTFQPDKLVTRAEFLKMLITSQDVDGQTLPNRLTYPFQDVPKDTWYAPVIQRAWDAGLLDKKQLLNPEDSVTRVEGIRHVLNLLGLPIPRFIAEEEWTLNFRDVRPDMWYAPTVLYGIRYGLITSPDPAENYFRPLKKLTRGEAAELVYNMDVYLLGTQIFDGAAELEGRLIDAGLTHDIPHLDILADVWTRIQEDHFNPASEGIDNDALMYEALKGLVSGLDDRYSVFLDPPETGTFQEYLEGEFGGIGAEIAEENGQVIIRSLLIDSPAEKTGLKPRDRIVKVDGTDVQGESAQAIVQKIRGEPGTDVTLTLEREEAFLDITLTRAVINLGYIKGEIMGDALYLDINMFTSLGFIDFTQTIKGLIEKKPDFKGFIFDLRDNPGGYLETVKSVLGHFVPYGQPLLYIKDNPTHSTLHLSTGDGEWEDKPVVLIINEGSASAAEIMAYVLYERNKAITVGETTFGKGTVQEVIDYKDGSSLKLTVAEWRTAKWHSLNEIGLDPVVLVKFKEEDRAAGRDPQLETALIEFDMLVERRAKAEAEAEAQAATTP